MIGPAIGLLCEGDFLEILGVRYKSMAGLIFVALLGWWPSIGLPLSPTPQWNCCQSQGDYGAQCRKEFALTDEKCIAINKAFVEAQEGWNAMNALNERLQWPATYLIDVSGIPVVTNSGVRVERGAKDQTP